MGRAGGRPRWLKPVEYTQDTDRVTIEAACNAHPAPHGGRISTQGFERICFFSPDSESNGGCLVFLDLLLPDFLLQSEPLGYTAAGPCRKLQTRVGRG